MKTVFRKFVRPAFTLIELVITIVVIGILSAALVATYSDVSSSANKAAQQASLSAMQSQIAIHLGANLSLPTMTQLTKEMANVSIVDSPDGYKVFQAGTSANPIIILAFNDSNCSQFIKMDGSNAVNGLTDSSAKVACVSLPPLDYGQAVGVPLQGQGGAKDVIQQDNPPKGNIAG